MVKAAADKQCEERSNRAGCSPEDDRNNNCINVTILKTKLKIDLHGEVRI